MSEPAEGTTTVDKEKAENDGTTGSKESEAANSKSEGENGGGGRSNKRTAERQISKDDYNVTSDDNEGEGGFGSFQKADPSVIAKRRIVRVKRRPCEKSNTKEQVENNKNSNNTNKEAAEKKETKSSNPFANATLKVDNKPKAPVFGSNTGFTGFATSSSSLLSNKAPTSSAWQFASTKSNADSCSEQPSQQSQSTSATTTTFGFGTSASSGFGTSSTKDNGSTSHTGSVFGSSTTTTTKGKNLFSSSNSKGFGFSFGSSTTKSSVSGTTGTDSADATCKPVVQLPEKVKLTTGEEEEIVLFENRCKTHKWVTASDTPSETTTTTTTTTTTSALQQSVPPSSSSLNTVSSKDENNPQDEKENDKQEKQQDKQQDQQRDKPQDKQNQKQQQQQQQSSSRWREIGTGPLRVLRSKKKEQQLRLVQRRESTPHGPATKVLVNLFLWKESSIQRPSEKHVQLTTLAPGKSSETYLFKFKMVQEAQGLQQCLEKALQSCQSIMSANKSSEPETVPDPKEKETTDTTQDVTKNHTEKAETETETKT